MKKIHIVAEGFGIDEICEVDKWVGSDLLLKRKQPRRFEFMSEYGRENFRFGSTQTCSGYLKGGRKHDYATIAIVNEEANPCH